jgi:phosphohistidine phosphatase
MRHGSTVPEEIDPKRPLSETGQDEVRRIARIMRDDKQVRVCQIIHSGKTRARQTAEIIAEYLNPLEGIRASDGLMPMDTPAIWTNRLKERRADIMLVAHLPYLSNLASQLLKDSNEGGYIQFETASAAGLLRSDTNRWSHLWQINP